MDWLLLRGLARESAHWGGLPERLRQARPQDRFHTLDLPGTGSHFGLEAPASIAGNRDFVIRETAHLPRPLTLLGLSMGAMVALDWAQHRPADCAGLVLINTSAGGSHAWQRLKARNWPLVAGLLLSPAVSFRERRILGLTSNRPLTGPVVDQWLDIQRQRPVSRRNVIRQLYAASAFTPLPQPPRVKALVLASRRDRLVDWRCSETLARSWNWPLRLHEDAGHDLPLDDPDWIIRQINDRFPPSSAACSG